MEGKKSGAAAAGTQSGAEGRERSGSEKAGKKDEGGVRGEA